MSNKSKILVVTKPNGQKSVKSCGVLVFREKNNKKEFLLMKHANRYDLPKGHQEEGETTTQTALRELREESGLLPDQIDIEDGFCYTETYYPTYKRFGNEKVEKTITIFLGRLKNPDSNIHLTEHKGFEWLEWNPPHKIQQSTIDPLLASVQQFWSNKS